MLGDYLVLTCSISSASSTAYQFDWLHKNSLLPAVTTPTLVLLGVTGSELGLYQCTVSNLTAMGTAFVNITAIRMYNNAN